MSRIKRALLIVKNKIKCKTITFSVIVLCSILALVCFSVSIKELVSRYNYEMQEIGNYDTYLYYTVGRALAQGLKPYADMYENKPPLIFILSALSFKMTGGFHMMNYLSALSFFVTLLVPIIFIAINFYKNKPNVAIGFIVLLFVASSSIMFNLFSEECSGEVQIEIFGTSASLLAVLFGTFENKRKKLRFLSPFCILSGVFWGIAIMLKEPFVIIVLVSILLFTHSRKQILTRIVYPLCYAAVVCVLIVLAGNCFVPYFTVYLSNMFSSHLSIYGSPFERMKNIKLIFDYYAMFSPSLALIIVLAFSFVIVAEINHTYSKKVKFDIAFKVINVVKVVLCLYLTSFAVGLGGQYYNHHYVFALGFFIACLMRGGQYAISLGAKKANNAIEQFKQFSLKNEILLTTPVVESGENSLEKVLASIDDQDINNQENIEQTQLKTEASSIVVSQEKVAMQIIKAMVIYVIMIVCVIYTCRGFTKTADYVVGTDYVISQTSTMKQNAKYIDDVLDVVGEERYLWIGFNGYNPYAYTEHLPLGPCFVQDVNNFQTSYGHFASEFKKQLRNANVIILSNLVFDLGSVTGYFLDYINKYFTPATPQSVQSIDKPLTFNYIIFYRK